MIGQPSSGNIEYFREESYRLQSSLATYNNVNQIMNNPYSSTASLSTTYTNELQIYNGGLRYPTINFSTIGSSITNKNFGIASTNYLGLTGERKYTRYFSFSSPGAFYKFGIKITGSASIQPLSTSLFNGSNQIQVEIKLPFNDSISGTYGGLTGWLDTATNLNLTGTPTNNSGCLDGSISGNTAIVNSTYYIQLAWLGVTTIPNLFASGGYFLMRITAADGWTGYITEIEVIPY
jgi:hypothetical protein